MILEMYDYFDIEVEKAEGIYIYDKKENKYIDTFSGIGVMAFGHSYKPLLLKFQEKMKKYMHISNFFLDEDALYVAEKLISFTGKKGKVFFTNSGTEAVEAALKAIKKISHNKKNKIIYFKNGFHGRTLGALSINGFENLKAPFRPLLSKCQEFLFNDVNGFNDYMEHHGEEVIAIFVEPIQGSGGIIPITDNFSKAINFWKEKYNYLIISDEIQAGIGRTGKFYSYEHFNLKPDIITLGKALGGGLPLGATLFLEETAEILTKGDHGSTFAPNPVSIAGAKYIVDNIPHMLNDIEEKGNYFFEKLENLNSFKIMDIRGKGLMIGIELDDSYHELKKIALSKGLLLNMIQNNFVIRLLPALNIKYDEIDKIINIMEGLIC
ncbi:aminotransferase class III [Marinitoga sp. 1135]|uniref:aspartate aminotransferase family protein n=1 Tax=Marinitoga sp. 1135 TaxID=1643333 RepID=UPI001586B050|nr:aminotransferase class III-fold pyridoxal phosphate-dependent enzyme [Marinitoga sp. 1135]NUU95244.1 aminotransferase class III [Marinitoga sp. 1135]